jgi:hypothetical protein
MTDVKDIFWLAGLLEGEGAFMVRNGSTKIAVQTTDRDVVGRVAALFGTKVDGDSWKPKGKATYKPVWSCSVHGTRAVGWMMTLFPLMGERRRTKIREIVLGWKSSPRTPRAPRGQRFMANCHPDRPRMGNGLCGTCYMRKYRKNFGATILTLA